MTRVLHVLRCVLRGWGEEGEGRGEDCNLLFQWYSMLTFFGTSNPSLKLANGCMSVDLREGITWSRKSFLSYVQY